MRTSRTTYFRKIPRNILSFEPSSGGFSATADGVGSDSEAVDGAVDAAGEGLKAEDPDDVDAMIEDLDQTIIKNPLWGRTSKIRKAEVEMGFYFFIFFF